MLGTGNAMCTHCYNTCFYLRTPHGGLMVDAGGGNGIFKQLMRAHIPFETIHHLFVTHCHTDHIMGAIWMIRKISPMIHKGKHSGPLNVYGNAAVCHALQTMCQLMMPSKIYSSIGSSIILHQVTDGQQIAIDDMQATFFDIYSTKAMQYGVSIVLPDHQRLTCLGDEPYSINAETYTQGCDWLLCEAFCLYKDRLQFNPYEKNHSTALDAGMLAAQLGVKNLVLYHTEDTHLETRNSNYTAEAKQHFKGRIYVPDDLGIIELQNKLEP